MQKHFKIIIFLALGFLFSSCATISKGTYQTIQVSSNPPGATVIVDNLNRGVTPTFVYLSRKDNHKMQIELSGYDKYLVVINGTMSLNSLLYFIGDYFVGGVVAAGALIISIFGAQDTKDFESTFSTLAVFYFLSPYIVDFYTGAINDLSPEIINVKLQKSETTSTDKQDKLLSPENK